MLVHFIFHEKEKTVINWKREAADLVIFLVPTAIFITILTQVWAYQAAIPVGVWCGAAVAAIIYRFKYRRD